MKDRRPRVVMALIATLIGGVSLPPAAGAQLPGLPGASRALNLDEPFTDVDEWRDTPVRHRYIHGGFKGTEARFSMYFPPKEHYDGRFFQPLMAVTGTENAASMAMAQHDSMDFAFATGAYLIESNQGSKSMFGDDATAAQVSSAVAEYSRKIAAEMYEYEHRPFGYVYGGSGGAFKTLTCITSHETWDGAVPFVHGSPAAIPSVFTAQAHAFRVLWEKFPSIVDAIEPGGNGDMYGGLNEEEKGALLEITRMGFPPRAWFHYEGIAFGYTGVFASLVDVIALGDPGYLEDFWTVPGYLGYDPPESLERARIHHATKIDALVMPDEAREMGLRLSMSGSQRDAGVDFPAAFRISDLPGGVLRGASVIFESGGAKGQSVYIVGRQDDLVTIGFGARAFAHLGKVKAGDEIEIDNSIYLASQTYHRHIVPSDDFYVWDQFEGPDGEPLYPQRKNKLSALISAGGGRMSGEFHGKMIVVQALMDEAAFPWQADWYRSRVEAVQGDDFHEKYRLYYVDHAMHTSHTAEPEDPRPVITTRTVSYQGALQQAIRDLSSWVEKGIAPPEETRYEVVDGQVVVPATAAERKGIQPVVSARVNGGERAEVTVGETVHFTGVIETPPDAGSVVSAEWDFEGSGEFPVVEKFTAEHGSRARVEVKASYVFSEPGTYFPALRGTSNREGDPESPHARIQNLGRVRVLVE